MIIGGALMSVSGWFLLFPYLPANVTALQFWTVIHAVIAMLFIAAMLAHIYIGSIGMEGAFDAMGTGEVDLNWAKEHHSLWVEEEQAKGHAPSGSAPRRAGRIIRLGHKSVLRKHMKVFLAALVFAAIAAVGVSIVLSTIQQPSSVAFTTSGARVGDPGTMIWPVGQG